MLWSGLSFVFHLHSLISAATFPPLLTPLPFPQPWLITFSVNEDIKLSAAAATAAKGNKHSSNINSSSNNKELPLFAAGFLFVLDFFSPFVYFYSHKKVALASWRYRQ